MDRDSRYERDREDREDRDRRDPIRDRDRGRGVRGSRGLGGDAYRPPRRASPPLREPYSDKYVPSATTFRPRSRSPAGRGSGYTGGYRDMPRSPRRFSPRRVLRFASPPRGPKAAARDIRYRSPPPRTNRSRSPGYYRPPSRRYSPGARPRSPLPPSSDRDRFTSRQGQEFSPRNDRRDRSPRRFEDDHPRRSSTRQPVIASRHASPPVHPSRARLVPDSNSGPSSVRSGHESPNPTPSFRCRPSPSREPESAGHYAPFQSTRDRARSPYAKSHRDTVIQSREHYDSSPTKSIAKTATNIPETLPRDTNPIFMAPSRPRGPRDGGGGGYGGYASSRELPARPTPRHPTNNNSFGRGGGGGHTGSHRGGSHISAAFRGSGNNTSTTYPRSQRFDNNTPPSASLNSPSNPTVQSSFANNSSHHQPPTPTSANSILKNRNHQPPSIRSHLADLTPIIPGGQKLPPIDPAAAERMRKLTEEGEKLRKELYERQQKLRTGLHEYEMRSADSRSARQRGDGLEETARQVAAGAGGMAAANSGGAGLNVSVGAMGEDTSSPLF